jgi:hypothetical protein
MRSALAAIVLLAMTSAAGASEILYDQPYQSSADCSTSCWIDSSFEGTGFQTFDDFTLAQTSVVSDVSWVGVYNASVNPISAPDTTSWTISLWSNAGDQPGSELYSQSVAEATVTATLLGDTDFDGSMISVYQFSLNIAPFVATADTTYWISEFSNEASGDSVFASAPGTGGDGVSWQVGLGEAAVFGAGVRDNDLAFSLSGMPVVPEPGTLALAWAAGLGLLGTWCLGRRRKTIRS